MPQWSVELEAFELVFLRRPDTAPELAEDVAERLQAEHLAFYDRLRAAGQVATNGPVIEPPDPSLRGLGFYRTGSLEDSRRLAEEDPSVRAGRLSVEVMTWFCPPGTMSLPGRPISLP